jgi:IS30 family transposase
MKLHPELVCSITDRLKEFDSPEQISGRLKRLNKTAVSPETIYQLIAKDRINGGHLYEYLRRGGRRQRKKHCPAGYKGSIKDRIDISQRPLIVEEKSRIGDLEIDTIVGADHSGFLVTAVDRASKMAFIAKTSTKEAYVVAKALIDRLNRTQSIFNRTLNLNAQNTPKIRLVDDLEYFYNY